MSELKKWGKRVVAGTTLAGVSAASAIGGHFAFYGGTPDEEGAVVNMQEDNAMMLHDIYDRPAFLNYFGLNRNAPLTLDISITTTDVMPDKMQDSMGQLTKYRQSHVSSEVTPEDFRAITPESAQVIRDFFREFEELTGIKVNVRENDPKADIAIGGYISHDNYIGFASFPQEVPIVSLLPQNQGFMMLDVNYMKQKLEEGKPEAVLALVSHEFGHNLGLLHPFDGLVDTGYSEKQQNGISRMAYNNHTFPAVTGTSIDSGFGPLDIFHIREALKDSGYDVPPVHQGDTTWNLTEAARETLEGARSKAGRLYQVPALSLLDTGGRNTLLGTGGDDLLVTEAGFCGLINRQEQQIALLRDGQPYCLVEGEFSVVKTGGGKDLVLTAAGTEQAVYLASGRQEVAILDANLGDQTIHTTAERQEGGIVEAAKELIGQADGTTLTLHYSLFNAMDAHASVSGDDVVLTFNAMSGREVGKITLKDQARESGIDNFRIIGNEGETFAEFDVRSLTTAEQWQQQVVAPVTQMVDEKGLAELRADIARARQGLAGSAGEWTAGTRFATQTEEEHSHGESPIRPENPDNPLHGKVGGDQQGDFQAILRRRRLETATQVKKNAR
ncbi:MAG: hypothetical protein FJX23_06250 [Alphaproteobacteria bacterium]|nr:hypothetical protein [Alphaproteobacteria bacterium]